MADITTPYSSAARLFGKPSEDWLDEYNAQRLAAYDLYEDMYWNNPDTYKIVMRGTNEQPIYLPTARIICNTMNRYVMRNWALVPDPVLGSDTERTTIKAEFEKLFRREKFRSKFNMAKLYGLIRGDAAFYLKADPLKPEGSRISINDVDPRSVFEITDEDDDEIVLGVEIIEKLVSATDDSKIYIRRQSWYKTQCPKHPNYTPDNTVYDGEIAYEEKSLELEGWNTPEMKPFSGAQSTPLTVITGIFSLPVYRWRSGVPEPGNPWGNSELRGLETIATGVNQAISDQDLALAIAGLGQYVTDAGAPVDDDGNETDWGIGPTEVIEIAVGRKFDRIKGVDTVEPSVRHIELLQDQAFRVNGASDVAQGRVDVSVAESGIALGLRMGPILDEASLRDQEIVDSVNQMLYDMAFWFEAYEGIGFGEATMTITPGPKLPENQEKWIETLMSGLAQQPPLFSQEFVWNELRRMGRDIPANMAKAIVDETLAYSEAADSYGSRVEEESGGNTVDPADLPDEEVE